MAKEKDIIIANRHAGPIVLPKVYLPNTSGDPAAFVQTFPERLLEPGHATTIGATEWEVRKVSQALQYYFDHGHLELVKREGEVLIQTGGTAVMEIPEHLQNDSEGGITVDSVTGDGAVSAKLRSAKKGTVTL